VTIGNSTQRAKHGPLIYKVEDKGKINLHGGPKKVSHYHYSSLNRIKTRYYG